MSSPTDVFLGIDQSYTGFAVVALNVDGYLVGEDVAKFDPAKHGTGIDRLIHIHNHLLKLLFRFDGTDNDICHVAMEGYSNGSKFGREQAGELGAIVKLALREHFDPSSAVGYPTIVSPTALKKYVTDNGGAKKSGMLLAVYKKWGYETTDDNLADAYSLARLARAVYRENSELAYEKTVLGNLKPYTEMPVRK